MFGECAGELAVDGQHRKVLLLRDRPRCDPRRERGNRAEVDLGARRLLHVARWIGPCVALGRALDRQRGMRSRFGFDGFGGPVWGVGRRGDEIAQGHEHHLIDLIAAADRDALTAVIDRDVENVVIGFVLREHRAESEIEYHQPAACDQRERDAAVACEAHHIRARERETMLDHRFA
ncbi:MAG: hypothetical protein KIT31_39305 [Deltaproteobacteria bacterium]|nr:hypothetical protein [Deltaproteobacteria bacterium]